MSDTENKKSASERLGDLEQAMAQVGQALSSLDLMGRDLMSTKEIVKLLNNKLDSVIKALNAGLSLTTENLDKFMTENNAKELADRVAAMVSQGILKASDTVTSDSFVVINEQDAGGTIVNPRMQFLVRELNQEEIRNKLVGSKVGTNISVGATGGSINILETYDISLPQVEPTAASESAAADSAATASSTETAATSDSATANASTTSSAATAAESQSVASA